MNDGLDPLAHAKEILLGVAVMQVAKLADSAVQIAIKRWVVVTDYGAVGGELSLGWEA